MANIPKLTEAAIRKRTGDRSFGLGRSYCESGAIYDARREAAALKARCSGSRGEAYRVRATFDAKAIASAECSCPVGGGGTCKHVAALLLTWIERPEEFSEAEEIGALLRRLDKKVLVELIEKMLDREPDLEMLLLPLTTKKAKRGEPADSEAFRRQAVAIFRRAGDEWGVEADIAEALTAILEAGDGYAKRKEYSNAAAVYDAVMSVVLDQLDYYEDEPGDLAGVVITCVDRLGKCLKGAKDGTVREAILKALFSAVHSDIEAGGQDLCGDAYELILDCTSAEERRSVASWVRALLARADLGKWERETLGGILLDLEAETMDNEAYLAACRETGGIYDLVTRLLELERLDEAVEVAASATDYELLGLADVFVKHGKAKVAEGLVLERSETTKDTRVFEWLEKRYEKAGDGAGALEMATRIFRTYPDFERYKRVRGLAKKLGRWNALRPSLIAKLKGNAYALVRVHLDESDLDGALDLVRADRYGAGMELEVAAAAEKTRPRDALEIYRRAAERQIAARGDYRPAVDLLKKVRALHKRLGEAAVWDSYIADLRTRERRLRNLMKELDGAGM